VSLRAWWDKLLGRTPAVTETPGPDPADHAPPPGEDIAPEVGDPRREAPQGDGKDEAEKPPDG
jgi:hypothetical protein